MNSIKLQPIISEKSMAKAANGIYMFEAHKKANKLQIADEVAKLFKVEVVQVRTTILKGKVKRFKGTIGTRADKKRAYVSLKAGQKITIFDAESKDDKVKTKKIKKDTK